VISKTTTTTPRRRTMAKRPRRSEGPKSSSSLAFASDKKATKGKIDDDAIEKRKAECRGTLEALNNQFYAHVAEQKRKNPIKSWAEGCQDYVKHLRKLMVRSLLTLSLFAHRTDCTTTFL
tara:strand:+ start:126 stop:485 length:360 start_codon:yes stop_codon:yes gene_type:complete